MVAIVYAQLDLIFFLTCGLFTNVILCLPRPSILFEQNTFSICYEYLHPLYLKKHRYRYRLCGHMGRAWDSTHCQREREVAGSPPGCGTIVGRVFRPARQLARFSFLNMPSILNLFRVGPRGEALNYRPSASPSMR